MKKLLVIMVLGLLFSGNVYSEIIRLKCIHKSQDSHFRENIRDPGYYTYDTSNTDAIITDSHISYYDVSNIVDTYFLGYNRINRYDGSHILKTVEVPKSIYINFKNLKGKYTEKDIQNLMLNVDRFFIKNKFSTKKVKNIYVEEKGECISLKKKF